MDLSLRSVGIDAFVLLLLIAEATALSCDLSQLGIETNNNEGVKILTGSPSANGPPFGTSFIESDGSILVLQGQSILRWHAEGPFIRSISLDLKRPTGFVSYEAGQYAVVDSDTKKMYVWGIDASSTALQKLSALLTLALPDGLVQPRTIKGYDPVSKMFFVNIKGVIKRAKINAAGNALEICSPAPVVPQGGTRRKTKGEKKQKVKTDDADVFYDDERAVMRVYADPSTPGQLLLFGQTKDKKMENENGNVNQIPFVATLTTEGQVLGRRTLPGHWSVTSWTAPVGVTVLPSGTIKYLFKPDNTVFYTLSLSCQKAGGFADVNASFTSAFEAATKLLLPLPQLKNKPPGGVPLIKQGMKGKNQPPNPFVKPVKWGGKKGWLPFDERVWKSVMMNTTSALAMQAQRKAAAAAAAKASKANGKADGKPDGNVFTPPPLGYRPMGIPIPPSGLGFPGMKLPPGMRMGPLGPVPIGAPYMHAAETTGGSLETFKLWKQCVPWPETMPGKHDDMCRRDFHKKNDRTFRHVGQERGGCAEGFGKGVCGSLPQKWHEAVENMRGGGLATPDHTLRVEMAQHGYFYNKTLDDFVKDLNWHAGEVFTEQDLNNHISRVRSAVGSGKIVDAFIILGVLFALCLVCQTCQKMASLMLRVLYVSLGCMITPCRPCMNRCGRKIFGKGYQAVNVYGPDLEVDLDAPETELLPLDRDAEA